MEPSLAHRNDRSAHKKHARSAGAIVVKYKNREIFLSTRKSAGNLSCLHHNCRIEQQLNRDWSNTLKRHSNTLCLTNRIYRVEAEVEDYLLSPILET